MVAPAGRTRIKPPRIVVEAWEFVTHPRKWGRAVSVLVGKVKYRYSLMIGKPAPNLGTFGKKGKNGEVVRIDKRKISHFTNPEAAEAHARNEVGRVNIDPANMRPHKLLGQGGFGKAEEVFPPEGEAGPIGVRKTPTPSEEVVVNASLVHEFEMLRELDHERIVKVNSARDAIPKSGADGIVMQHGGSSLEKLAKTEVGGEKVFNPFLFQRIAKQSLEALAYLKEKNIYHRDIKPGNIVLGAGGDIKVVDFGIAEKLPEGQMSSDMKGTLNYMAPEMIQRPYLSDIRGDMYALGCTIYNIITGDDFRSAMHGGVDGLVELINAPFPQNKLDNLERHIRNYAPDLPPEFVSEIAPLLKSMMAHDPARRITPEEALQHRFFAGKF